MEGNRIFRGDRVHMCILLLHYSFYQLIILLLYLFALVLTHTHTRNLSQVALVVKNLPANAGGVRNVGSVPGLERSPGGGHDNLCSCLENPTDKKSLVCYNP